LPVFPHDAANSSVLIHGDYVYVGTANGVYDGKVVLPTAPSLIALNKTTGQLVARDDGQISAKVFHGQWSSPAAITVEGRELIIYGGGDGECYAFEPVAPGTTAPTVLKEVWNFDANPPGYRERNGKLIDYWSLVKKGGKDLLTDGELVSPSEIIGSPVIYKDRVYVTIGQDPLHGRGRGAVSCIDAKGHGDITASGRIWQYENIGRTLSTVAIADGLLYVAEHAGKIHCLDAETGDVKWIYDTAEEIWSSTLVVDGKVFVGTRRGITVLAAGPEERHIADIKTGTPVWSAPTAANGKLYVASQKNLWAIVEKHEVE
jgi:outer membrane protein assembly factor BamB